MPCRFDAGSMVSDLPEWLRALLTTQHGVLTRPQALSGGMTDKAIEVRLRSGRWQRLQLGVYATFSGEPPRPALIWAAVLRGGPDAVLSHQTAAELSGLMASPQSLIHLTVPSGAQVARIPGVVVHYSGRLVSRAIRYSNQPGPGSRRRCSIWARRPAPWTPPSAGSSWPVAAARPPRSGSPRRWLCAPGCAGALIWRWRSMPPARARSPCSNSGT
jgi:hypothetical protein